MDNNIVLKIQNVSKIYPGVKALDRINIELKRGEVRALLGENGAGKSTLIKCVMGVEKADEGEILVNSGTGEWKQPKNAIDAKELGLYANYQHVNIARELSVAENYFMGKLPKNKAGVIDWKKVYSDSEKVLEKFEIDEIDPRQPIRSLPAALQEMVTISKISLNDNIRVVIFDEPTALLENDKVEILYQYIRELKKQNVSIIYISHRLEEIFEICDSVTVLKDGKFVGTKRIEEVDKNSLVEMMVGRTVENIYNIKHFEPGKELIRIEGLTRKKEFQDISFHVREGEILGFFGLIGAGRSEVMKCLFGIELPDSGKIYVDGKETVIKSPKDAMKNRIGLIPEDRQVEGLALELSVKMNINMSSYDMISRAGFINIAKETERANDFVKRVGVKTPSVGQLVKNLSGGNQQKVVVSKLLCRDPEIFIFDEPTVGVDVGAKQEIYAIIEKLTRNGKAVILISSYLPEVMGLSDRLIIMSEGKIVGEMDNEELKQATEKDVMAVAAS